MTDSLASSNARVQRLRRLASRRDARREEGVLVVEGSVLLLEAARAGWEIESQFVAPHGVPVDADGDVFMVASGVLERIATTQTPQPVVGIVRMPVRMESGVGEGDLDSWNFIVTADGVSDPGNLGTMIRSAAGAGADALAVTPGTVDYTNPKVVRASAGSIFHLPVVEVPGCGFAKDRGIVSIGTSSHSGRCYTEVDLTRRVALVFGSEPRGLGSDSPVDEWVNIPLSAGVESLNVAMACAVMCFEVARQRRVSSGTLGEP